MICHLDLIILLDIVDSEFHATEPIDLHYFTNHAILKLLGNLTKYIYGGIIIMKLSAPKAIVFWIAVALAVLALLSVLGVFSLGFISAAWLALIAFVLLMLGNILKGF